MRGVDLFDDSKPSETLPLLEAGFTGRENATFADPNDLGLWQKLIKEDL